MKNEYKVYYVSNGTNKTSKDKIVIAEDQYEAKKKVEAEGNKVNSVVYVRARFDL